MIFRGLDADLPGVSLSEPYETTDVVVDRLSDHRASRSRDGIAADDSTTRAHDRAEPRRQDVPGRAERGQDGRLRDGSARRDHGLRAPAPPGRGALPARSGAAVGIGAYAAVGIGVQGEVPADIVGYGGWLAALMIVAHIVVRIVAPYADPVLLPVVAALNGLGLAVIHRLDLATATPASRASS